MTAFEARPPGNALVPVVVAATVAMLASAAAPLSVAIGGGGAAMLILGTHSGSRRLVTIGGGTLFLGVLLGAYAGVPPRFTLVSAAAAVVALDAGEHVVSIAHDVGANSRVGQAVLVHVATTASIALGVAGIGFTVYVFGPVGLPLTGLLALLFAVIFLAYALQE